MWVGGGGEGGGVGQGVETLINVSTQVPIPKTLLTHKFI